MEAKHSINPLALSIVIDELLSKFFNLVQKIKVKT